MPQPKGPQRCNKACERCRSMKVKCSGAQPCSRCSRRRKQCRYILQDKQISVPESYLRELQSRSDRNSTAPAVVGQEVELADRPGSTGAPGILQDIDGDVIEVVQDPKPEVLSAQPSEQDAPGEPDFLQSDAVESSFRQNPLVDADYTFARAEGKYWYMGPSSSWSFCRRVLAFLGKRIPESYQTPDQFNLDGKAFRMQWSALSYYETPDTSDLPPLDYALFLLQTVKFYFAVLFNLIDEPAFVRDLYELYRDPATKVKNSRLWYAQYLLILAFGKAFINASSGHHGPPGHQYALRALSLMPDLTGMDVNAFQSIRALALASLYLQSIDMRMAAYHHIGQALRTCIIEGMHRHVPEEVVGQEMSAHANTIFWVVYMIDREFSAQLGGPSSIRDEDITAKSPIYVKENLDAWNMSLHVELSRLVAQILSTVYGVGKEFDEALVKNTQAILRNLARIASDLADLLDTHFHGSANKASRVASRLVLAYHHCVVLSTRPLVMCALHAHIEHAQGEGDNTISLAPPVASLIQSCVDSALASLRTLRVLGDEGMLETFLPFQLDETFSSAFLLHLIQYILPSFLPDTAWKRNTEKVLDRMITRGNVVAPLRKLELNQLEAMMMHITPRETQVLIQSPNSSDQLSQAIDASGLISEHLDGGHWWDAFDEDGGVGLSPRVLLDLAEQLDVNFLINSVSV